MNYKCICGKERKINSLYGLSRRCPSCGLTYAKAEEIRVGRYLEAQERMSVATRAALLELAHRYRPENREKEIKRLIAFVEEHLEEMKGLEADVYYLLADFYFEGRYVREDMSKVRKYIEESIALHGRNAANASLKLIVDSEDGKLKPGEFEAALEKLAKGEC